ncbi:MAG: DUF4258 domain-containing protein [Deltaproteobacteria bacterium]|nr:DUF4258 domain-containing protein [Deltaproteobacteria bacterium]
MKKAPDQFSRSEALKHIRENWVKGSILSSRHFRERLIERNITMQDVAYAVKHGRIEDPPDLHPKTNEWCYRVKGRTVDKIPVTVVIELGDPDINRLVTVYPGE